MRQSEMNAEALSRASGFSTSNFGAVFLGFMAKGLPENEIKPKVNVFTYRAWKAKGRQVRKGEHGVQVQTWVPIVAREKSRKTGKVEKVERVRPRSATVFHITQTDAIGGAA